jgi:hypothetical protein
MACLLLSAPRVHAATVGSSNAPAISAASAPTFALQEPEKKIDITVGDRGGSAPWYRSPVWIAIGSIAVLLLLLIIVLALRGTGGGGTTIIRE